MNSRRFLLTIVTMLTMTVPSLAGGLGGGVQIYDGDFGIQVRNDFRIGGDIGSVTGQVGIVFAGSEVLTLDADYHFNVTREQTRFYGLVGPQLAFNSDFTEFGINAGAGLNFMMTDTKAGFAELKLVLISDFDGLAATAGLYF